MRRVHIEKKAWSTEAAMEAVRRGLVGRLGVWVSAADAAVASGLPLADAERALLALSTRHACRVGVAESGALVVSFAELELERPAGPVRRWLGRVRAWMAKYRDQLLAAFTVTLFPVVVLLGMVGSFSLVYALEQQQHLAPGWAEIPLMVLGGVTALVWIFTIFGVLAVAMLTYLGVAMLSAPVTASLRPLWDEAYAQDFELGMHIAVSIFVSLIGVMLGIQCLKLVREGWRKVFAGESAKWAPRFWRSVGGLLFGPPRERVDALADERVLVGRIRDLSGVVTTADLMGLFGWTPERADSEIVRVMMDYGGDVMVTDEGAILWVFPELGARSLGAIEEIGATGEAAETGRGVQAGGSAARGGASRAGEREAWERVFRVPIPRLSRFLGCSRRFAIASVVMMVPCVLGPMVHPALVTLPGPDDMFAWHGDPAQSDPLMQSLGAWPALVLLVGVLGRAPLWWWRRRRDKTQLRELELIRRVCEEPDGAWVPARGLDPRAVARLEGELGEARGGDGGEEEVLVRFPKAALAFSAAERVRRGGGRSGSGA